MPSSRPPVRRSILAAALVLGALAVPTSAGAEQITTDELHRLASEAYRAGDYAKAEDYLTSLWGTERSIRAACDLGQTLSKREEWARAAAMMDHCASLAGERISERTRAARRAVMERVQRLDIVTKPDGAEVSVSGAARGEKSFYVAPGPYELVVSHPGYLTVTRQLTAAAGERATHELILERDPSVAVAPELTGAEPEVVPEPMPPEEGPDYTARNLVVLGAGVLAAGSLAVAIVFNASAASERDRWEELGGESCGPANRQVRCLEAPGAAADWESDRNTRNVFLGVGAGFAVLGAAAYLLWPEPTRSAARFEHGFSVAAGGGQWTISGRF
ncbi:MAG: PEGA domain-containing protein [Polyangiaceae bacterium]|nr:PEGA domain-containing protein [Polyangiaceae bacterium]